MPFTAWCPQKINHQTKPVANSINSLTEKHPLFGPCIPLPFCPRFCRRLIEMWQDERGETQDVVNEASRFFAMLNHKRLEGLESKKIRTFIVTASTMFAQTFTDPEYFYRLNISDGVEVRVIFGGN